MRDLGMSERAEDFERMVMSGTEVQVLLVDQVCQDFLPAPSN
jgi:hypothetical protein